ncbi:MAG TPA: translation initiation factor IF-3, partial [Flavobacteriales bacterium]|nr:translation initiation factor IF-3 [Flavobacteriales bacterium]
MRRPYFARREPEVLHKINEHITASQIRMVGDNVEPGVVSLEKGLAMADDLDLDLVEISTKTDPPICKIIDYKKFLYEQRKKQKKIKANTSKVVLKELRFGPNTDDHDFNFKLKHAIKFLQDGSKLKA